MYSSSFTLSRIAASVQKQIKEIVANDGNVDSANDFLRKFKDSTNGAVVLALAQDLMRELKLTYTEQVYLQESGFDLEGVVETKIKEEIGKLLGAKKDKSVAGDLVDWYKKNGQQQEPHLQIVQTDGPIDDCSFDRVSDFPLFYSCSFSTSNSSCPLTP